MNIFDLLKGKKMMVTTDMNVVVELEIKEIQVNQHSEDLEPSTRENDWYPKTRDWVTYTVHFTNGSKKDYSSIDDIKFH